MLDSLTGAKGYRVGASKVASTGALDGCCISFYPSGLFLDMAETVDSYELRQNSSINAPSTIIIPNIKKGLPIGPLYTVY